MGLANASITILKKLPLVRTSYYALKLGKLALRDWCYELTGRTYAARHLQQLFAGTTDPWSFEKSELARERFERVWELVPPGPYARILEIGCAEGHFTEQIAQRFGTEIVALDFMPLALERAAQRCAAYPQVRCAALDVGTSDLPGTFDLIFCMGVLEYGPRRREQARIRDHIVNALRPGGLLLVESDRLPADMERRWWVRKLGWGARALHDRFLERPEMELARETMTFGGRRLASLLRKRPQGGA